MGKFFNPILSRWKQKVDIKFFWEKKSCFKVFLKSYRSGERGKQQRPKYLQIQISILAPSLTHSLVHQQSPTHCRLIVEWWLLGLQNKFHFTWQGVGSHPHTPKNQLTFSWRLCLQQRFYLSFQHSTSFQIYKTKGHHQQISSFTWNFIVEQIFTGSPVHSPITFANLLLTILFRFPDVSVSTHLKPLHDGNSTISLGNLFQSFIYLRRLNFPFFTYLKTLGCSPTIFPPSGLTI